MFVNGPAMAFGGRGDDLYYHESSLATLIELPGEGRDRVEVCVRELVFALWSKGIAVSRELFAIGVSYYDFGFSYQELVAAGVAFFAGDSDQAFAQRLAGNVASGKSAADLLALMQANGGAGPGQPGRDWATRIVADHPDNLANIELAGFVTGGIPCALFVDGNSMFASIGGG